MLLLEIRAFIKQFTHSLKYIEFRIWINNFLYFTKSTFNFLSFVWSWYGFHVFLNASSTVSRVFLSLKCCGEKNFIITSQNYQKYCWTQMACKLALVEHRKSKQQLLRSIAFFSNSKFAICNAEQLTKKKNLNSALCAMC